MSSNARRETFIETDIASLEEAMGDETQPISFIKAKYKGDEETILDRISNSTIGLRDYDIEVNGQVEKVQGLCFNLFHKK